MAEQRRDNLLAMINEVRAAPWASKLYVDLDKSEKQSLRRMVSRGLTTALHNQQILTLIQPPAADHDLWGQAVSDVVGSAEARELPIADAIGSVSLEAWLKYLR